MHYFSYAYLEKVMFNFREVGSFRLRSRSWGSAWILISLAISFSVFLTCPHVDFCRTCRILSTRHNITNVMLGSCRQFCLIWYLSFVALVLRALSLTGLTFARCRAAL